MPLQIFKGQEIANNFFLRCEGCRALRTGEGIICSYLRKVILTAYLSRLGSGGRWCLRGWGVCNFFFFFYVCESCLYCGGKKKKKPTSARGEVFRVWLPWLPLVMRGITWPMLWNYDDRRDMSSLTDWMKKRVERDRRIDPIPLISQLFAASMVSAQPWLKFADGDIESTAMLRNKPQRRIGRKTMALISIRGSLNANAAEELAVIKALTATDSDTAPFCACPVAPVNEI